MEQSTSIVLMPQTGPRNLFDHIRVKQMKKTVILIANPKIPRAISGNGVHDSTGHSTHGNKPAILQVGNPAERGDPNSSALVLKEGKHITRQSAASLAINRNPPVIPSVQAIESAKPNAAIPGRQNRLNEGVRQTLLYRDRGDGEVAKAVEAVTRGDPDIAFPILQETCNEIAGEAVGTRAHTGLSPV